jgi:hypothetical protein
VRLLFTRDIKQWILSLKEGEIILAKSAYTENFSDMKEATFYQLLARLNQEKYIAKISKGLYYKPFKEDFNKLPSQDKLLNFFTNKNKNGLIIGANMLYKYNIIDTKSDTYEIYTNLIEIKTVRYMSNLAIQYVNVDYKNQLITSTIEILEVIEIIDSYKNINYQALNEFLKLYSTNFDEDILYKVIQSHSYKKRNIYTLMNILNHFNVSNNLSRLLNSASKYNFPISIKKALTL